MLASPCAASGPTPPASLIEKGVCPFECCTYREWTATKTAKIHSAPDRSSRVLAHISPGTHVSALTGEVHVTRPGKYRVRKQFDKYRPGDLIWLYGYHGEGLYTVWFKGQQYEQEFSSVNYDGQGGYRCDDVDWCWGVLERAPESTWWIKLRTPGGVVGWTDQGANFSGKDACG